MNNLIMVLTVLVCVPGCFTTVKRVDPPAEVKTLFHWRAQRWTAKRMTELLVQYPTHRIDLGYWFPRDLDDKNLVELKTVLAEFRALGGDFSRFQWSVRYDVWYPNPYITTPGLSKWTGSYKQDPKPEWLLDRTDKCLPNIAYPDWIDRAELDRIKGKDKWFPYGNAGVDGGGLSAVGFDIRNMEYVEWMSKFNRAMLEQVGITKDDKINIQFTFKPGWWNYCDDCTDVGQNCFTPGWNRYNGPNCAGGPFCVTPYKKGEFEKAYNEGMILWMVRDREAGYKFVYSTAERPDFKKKKWNLLTDFTTTLLIGEQGENLMNIK
jgi:hypothetical protein